MLPWKQPVRAKTTAALAANTYANGTSGVGATLTGNANGALAAQGGVTLVAGERLLVANEATGSHNGIYTITQVGDASHPYILTRTTDADTGAKLVNATCKISEGTAADQEWQCTNNGTITIGTTALVWAKAALEDAPSDGTGYVRKNGAWASESGGSVGGGGSATVYQVASAGDAFIAVPLDSDNGLAYRVVVRGTLPSDGGIWMRISNDNAVTFKSGAADYKSQSSNSTANMNLTNATIGSGREFVVSLTLTGMNGGASPRRFVFAGTSTCVQNTGVLAVLAIAGYPNGLTADDYNGFEILSSGVAALNDVKVFVTKIL
jgi:hypothetical protein